MIRPWLAAALLLLPGRPAAGEEGMRLYFGTGLVGRIAGVPRPGLTCAGCHGRTGAGPPEGRGRVPPIGGTALTHPPDGATPYDDAAFARALAEGVTPGGRSLSAGMPRFALPAEQARRLRAALAALAEEDRAGVAPDRVTVVIPTLPARRPGAELFRDRLRRALDARGSSVYGRTIAVAIEEIDGAPGGARALAAVGPELDAEGRIAGLLWERGLPILMPRGSPPGPGSGDLVDGRPDERDVERALRTLRDAAPIPGRDRDPAILDGDDLAAFRAAPPQGRTVFLSRALVSERPAEVEALIATGVAVVALRPAAWDDGRIAEEAARVLLGALTLAGRDVTRTALLAALTRLRGREMPAGRERVEAVRLPAPPPGCPPAFDPPTLRDPECRLSSRPPP
ncbi:MAG: hypothetical protein PGN34_19685 [Methylobacterium frigidaeris]